MKLSTTLASVALATAVAVGTAGVAFGADGGSSPTVPSPSSDNASSRVTQRCAKAPVAQQKITERLSTLNERLTKLNAALAKATAASKDTLVERIQRRINNVEKRIDRVTTLQDKVTDWVSAHCPAS